MSKPATEDELSGLHAELASVLTEAIQPEEVVDGEGRVVGRRFNTAALNVARQFLKDNNITSTLDSKPLQDLVGAIPTFDDDTAFTFVPRND